MIAEGQEPRLRILVVDDDAQWLQIASRWLTMAGCEVLTHEGALGTTRAVFDHQPDLVLLDVIMDGLRGDELTRVLKRNPKTRHIPVILHSGMDEDDLNVLIMQTGAIGAIQKTGSGARFFADFYPLLAKVNLRITAA